MLLGRPSPGRARVSLLEPKHDSNGLQPRNGCVSSTAIGAAQRASGRNAGASHGRGTDLDGVDADDLREEAVRGLLDMDLIVSPGEHRGREGDVGSGHAAAVLSAVLEREA